MRKLNLEWLEAVFISLGKHNNRGEGTCVMEAAAYIAGEYHTDRPQCVDSHITALMIHRNDSSNDDERQRLKTLIPMILDTDETPSTPNKNVRLQRLSQLYGFAVKHPLTYDEFHDHIIRMARVAKGLPEEG